MSRSGRRRRAFFAMGMGIAIGAALIAASISEFAVRRDLGAVDGADGGLALSGAAGVPKMLEGIPQDGTAVGRSECPGDARRICGSSVPVLRRVGRRHASHAPRGLRARRQASHRVPRPCLHRTRLGDRAANSGRRRAPGASCWEAVELLYANQGEENSGWVTEDFLARMTATIPGLQARRLAADRHSAAVDTEIAKAQAQAQAANVRGTPAFGIGRTGRGLRLLEVTSLEPGQFRAAIEAILAE